MGEIYVIAFKNGGSCYVGKGKGKGGAKRRLRDHLRDARNNPQYAIDYAILKYRPENILQFVLMRNVPEDQLNQ